MLPLMSDLIIRPSPPELGGLENPPEFELDEEKFLFFFSGRIFRNRGIVPNSLVLNVLLNWP